MTLIVVKVNSNIGIVMIVYLLFFLFLTWCFLELIELKINPYDGLLFVKQKLIAKRNNYKDFTDYLIRSNFQKEIPKYKFFGDIIFELVRLRKKHGVNIKPACREIRVAVQKDKRESAKINSEFHSLVFQYLMIGSFTWYFLFHIQTSLPTHFNNFQVMLLACWQILGLVFGLVAFLFLKHKLFAEVGQFFYTSYIFRSLIYVSRPVTEILQSSKLDQLKTSKQLGFIRDRFFLLVDELKTKGNIPLEEFSNIINELWDFYDEQQLALKKWTGALKLILVLFFVFPGFLYVIYLSMSRMGI